MHGNNEGGSRYDRSLRSFEQSKKWLRSFMHACFEKKLVDKILWVIEIVFNISFLEL